MSVVGIGGWIKRFMVGDGTMYQTYISWWICYVIEILVLSRIMGVCVV